MEPKPISVEQIYDASISEVWNAITNAAEMTQWYFKLSEFKPELGFKFQFMGGTEDKQYLHKCEITEVIPLQKLSHSWQYDGYSGNSSVTFELYPEGSQTRLKLTHSGIESFPNEEKDFVKSNFQKGWEHILSISLFDYLNK